MNNSFENLYRLFQEGSRAEVVPSDNSVSIPEQPSVFGNTQLTRLLEIWTSPK